MTKKEYTDCDRKGLDEKLPEIECFRNHFAGTTVTVEIPEFTSICPKTGLPDFGVVTITYEPAERVIELKSLKHYILAYRDLGIFNENAVNRILADCVKACKPVWASVRGVFAPRGGISTTVEAHYAKKIKGETVWRRLSNGSNN